ncbi:exodeoxyribonuclease V subunit beta [Marmoricola sp. URHB0036]|uniref:UvrD-helicase domain-containing protein n=1 Tax=Marmoricola sp. URHB0036 TaxID=1298863 RepID=UPI00040E545D|nr:ATP-dependent helicase [Marmoricola sp. URHB0036]
MLDEDALWRRCELAWGSWLEDRGYAVTPLGEAVGNTERSRAPLTKVGGEHLRSPDFSAIKGGATAFWEVKSRSRASVDPLTGESQHWIDKAAFTDYLKISAKTGTPVWVVLYEAPTATAPGRWLQTDVEHLREVGSYDVRRGASGGFVPAWVWPVSEMHEVPGPVVDVAVGEEPILPDEGEGDAVEAADLFPVERTLRRRRSVVAVVDAPEAKRAKDVVAEGPLPHEWLEQDPALALDVLRRSLGVPHFPRYSVLRIGLEGIDLDDLLGLVEYGVRVFIVSTTTRAHLLAHERFKAYEDARLLEWAVVADVDLTDTWIVDGEGLDALPNSVKAALMAADAAGGLNLAQYRVVHAPADSDVVVSAGAGTGKTETMSERIVYLLATGSGRSTGKGEEPQDLRADEIALITFTRESASEMRHRIARTLLLRQRLCGSCALPVLAWMLQLARADITTIHSFAKRVIASGGGAIGLGPDARVARRTLEVQDAVQQALSSRLVQLIDQHHEKVPAAYEWQRHVLAVWEALENNGVDLLGVARPSGVDDVDWGSSPDGHLGQQVVALTKAVVEDAAATLSATYLRDQTLPTNALVPAATAVLRTKGEPQVRPYRHLFVDEFQDTDAGQMDLVLDVRERLGARLFVVGDVKQGIYRFRGAEGNAFHELDERFGARELPAPRTYNLTRNFRSGEKLLDSMHPWFAAWGSEDLLPYSPQDRLRPQIRQTDPSCPASIERISVKDFAVEAAAIVERWQTPESGDQIGILCRENWQAIAVQRAVRERKLPCELRVGGSFWSSPAVRDLRVLLEAVADHDDAAALLELCETRWAAGILGGQAPTGVEAMSWGGDVGVPVAWQTRFVHVVEDGSFRRDDLAPLRDRMGLLAGLLSTAPLLEWVVECTRVFAPEACSLPGEDDETERRRYGRCLDHLLTLLDAQFQDGPLSLERLLSWLRLQIATNRTEDEPDPETGGRIVALTVHKAKGLEYDRVVVPSTNRQFGPPRSVTTRTAVLRPPDEQVRLLWRWHLNKGQWNETDYTNVPVTRQLDDWGTDDTDTAREEARLLYVAMTRAKEELVLMVDHRARVSTTSPTCWADLLMMGDPRG